MGLPKSREQRLEEGSDLDFPESVALRIYSGGTTELLHGIVGIELTIESRRADAARELARLLRIKLAVEGYIVTSDIDDCSEEFLESNILKEN